MQRMELKVFNYEKYLQRRALTDPEAIQLLKKYEARLTRDDQNSRGVTNVVEDNNTLRRELKDAMQEINRLEQQITTLQDRLSRTYRVGDEGPFNQSINDVSMSELDIYQSMRPSDVMKVPEMLADLNDFVSGMSEIAIGHKARQKKEDKVIDLMTLSEKSEPEEIEAAQEYVDEIDIIDV